jgi:hypothetical protein
LVLQVHAHAAARLPLEKLHEAKSVHKMLPQPGARGDAPQPLPAGLPRRRLHELPDRHGGRPAAALQGRLRQVLEEDLRGVQGEQRPRPNHMALQGQAHRQGDRDPQDPRLLRPE